MVVGFFVKMNHFAMREVRLKRDINVFRVPQLDSTLRKPVLIYPLPDGEKGYEIHSRYLGITFSWIGGADTIHWSQ